MPPTSSQSSANSPFSKPTLAEWPLSATAMKGPSLLDVTAHRFPYVDRPTTTTTVVGLPDHAAAYRLVASAITVAVDRLGKIEVDARNTAASFRGRSLPLANIRLLALVEGLRLVTTLAQMAADTAKIDLATLGIDDGMLAPLDRMGVTLDQLTAHQVAEEWAGVALTLETELAPALNGWRVLFETILMQADVKFRECRAS